MALLRLRARLIAAESRSSKSRDTLADARSHRAFFLLQGKPSANIAVPWQARLPTVGAPSNGEGSFCRSGFCRSGFPAAIIIESRLKAAPPRTTANLIYIQYQHGITAIDTGLLRPQHTASYLVQSNGGAAFIETGPSHAIPRQMQALENAGLSPEDVDYVIPTHVHLDHAGGAGELIRRCPNAKLVIHPRGARHMIDPARLIAGATAVYGEAELRKHYGDIIPVPAERVIEADDGYELDWRGRKLVFVDTPGHARHHFCVWDEISKGFFSGDTFGLSYREFDTDNGPFMFPTTTPVQFDPAALHESIDRLLSFKPERMFLTHYGMVEDVPHLAEHLHRRLDDLVAIGRTNAGREDRYQRISEQLMIYLLGDARAHGCDMDDKTMTELFAMDVELNTRGVEVWLDKHGAEAP